MLKRERSKKDGVWTQVIREKLTTGVQISLPPSLLPFLPSLYPIFLLFFLPATFSFSPFYFKYIGDERTTRYLSRGCLIRVVMEQTY